jgi:hypothetical protein
VVVVLPRTSGEDGVAFRDRLDEELQAKVLVEGSTLATAFLSFPDDGDSAESLYSIAEAAVRQSALA